MASTKNLDKYTQELGTLICERAGLDIHAVSADFDITPAGDGDVMATMRIPVRIPRDEYIRLAREASDRASA